MFRPKESGLLELIIKFTLKFTPAEKKLHPT